jgi:O-methyltransferase involved in polyketide biosynthesis
LLQNRTEVDRLSYFEVDFPEITAHKAGSIRKHAELSKVLGDIRYGGYTNSLKPI